MTDKKPQPQKAAAQKDEKPSVEVLILPVEFDLKMFEEKPEMTRGQHRRAKDRVRSELDYNDKDNNGRLDATELSAITGASDEAEKFIGVVKSALLQENLVATEINKTLTAVTPFSVQPTPFRYVLPPTTASFDDQVVINREDLKTGIAQQMGLKPEEVEKIIRKVLPNGVEDYKLSTACHDNPELLCAPITPGKIQISLTPPERT